MRRIERLDVFYVTVVWSTFAYIWLYLILAVFSPNVVDVVEGVLTLLFFVVFVVNAFVFDRFAPSFGRRLLKRNQTGFRRNLSHSKHHHQHGPNAKAPQQNGIPQEDDLEAA